MNPIAKIYAIAKDEETLRHIFVLMQEHLSSVREKSHFLSKPAGLDDWVKLEIDEFSTTGYLERRYDFWDKMLKVCGSEIGEDGAVFVAFDYPDSRPPYFEYASSKSYEDTNYRNGYNRRDEVLEKFRNDVTDSFNRGKRLYLWFAVEAGILPADSADLSDNEEIPELPLKWSVGRKEPYAKSVDHVRKKVEFPLKIGKTTVTGIADSFEFKGDTRRTVEEVIIPEGYLYIGEKAFSKCPKLKKVTLPSSLTTIGKEAFSFCPKLESIIIPGGVKVISENAFTNCKSLKELTIEEGVECIEFAAFSDCVKLDGVVIPDSVKTIDGLAFENCSALKNLVIPEDAEVEASAFSGCTALAGKNEMVIVGNKLSKYVGSEETVVIPQGIEEIGASAFAENRTVKSVIIPDSVREIGPCAFEWCTGLREIIIPKGVEKIYRLTFCNCQSLKNVVIPDSVTEIGENAFIGCFMLKTVDLPESVMSVGANAFSDTSFTAPDITIIIRNPELVMHRTCLEGCKQFTIYAPVGSPASRFSPSRTKPLEEYTGA